MSLAPGDIGIRHRSLANARQDATANSPEAQVELEYSLVKKIPVRSGAGRVVFFIAGDGSLREAERYPVWRLIGSDDPRLLKRWTRRGLDGQRIVHYQVALGDIIRHVDLRRCPMRVRARLLPVFGDGFWDVLETIEEASMAEVEPNALRHPGMVSQAVAQTCRKRIAAGGLPTAAEAGKIRTEWCKFKFPPHRNGA